MAPNGTGLEASLHLFHRHIPHLEDFLLRQRVRRLFRMKGRLVQDFGAVDISNSCEADLRSDLRRPIYVGNWPSWTEKSRI